MPLFSLGPAITRPGCAFRVRQSGGGYQVPMRAVGLPAMVLPPRHFIRVLLQPMSV